MARRGLGCSAGLLLAASVLAWIAWLTGHPSSPSLDRIARWSPAAPWVERFRAVFAPPSPPRSEPPPPPEVVLVAPDPARFRALPRVWVPEGTPLHAEPEAGSPVVSRIEATSNLATSESRGAWYRVRRPGRREDAGWVLLPEPEVPPVRPATPEPTVPLAAAAPAEELLAAARAAMAAPVREHGCGGYRLVTDVEDAVLQGLCGRVVAPLDAAYAAAFGVEPMGTPAEAILLFADREAFQRFAHEVSGVRVGYAGHARAARGYVALPAGSPEETSRTLVHELTHLVNRRALGPALPRWLSEGTADFLGDAAGPDGPGTVPGVRGSIGEIERLQQAAEAGLVGSLERLLSLGPEEFDASVPSFDYEQSAFLVRLLLTDRDLAPRFRRYLARLADGAAYDPEDLRRGLAVEWTDLERTFAVRLRAAYLPPRTQKIRVE